MSIVSPDITGFSASHDLQELFDVPIAQEAVKHVYHSGQFRSSLIKRRAFWAQFIRDLVTPYNQPRP
jgi:hypothetical protein